MKMIKSQKVLGEDIELTGFMMNTSSEIKARKLLKVMGLRQNVKERKKYHW
jgi:hypothetical protein